MGEAEESALPPVEPLHSEGVFVQQPKPLARDPVCGMDVDPIAPAGSVEHMGVPYYFCSPVCKATFQADPARYAI